MMAETLEQTPQADEREQAKQEREQERAERRQQQEQEAFDAAQKQREQDAQRAKEAKQAANSYADRFLEDVTPPESSDTYQMCQQMERIRQQLHANDSMALSEIAKCILSLLPKKLKQATDEGEGDVADPVLHLHGRNVVPGVKTHIPAAAEIPVALASKRTDHAVTADELAEARAVEKEEIEMANNPKRPSDDDKEKDSPGRRPQQERDRPAEPGTAPHPDTAHGERTPPGQQQEPKHEPNPPAR